MTKTPPRVNQGDDLELGAARALPKSASASTHWRLATDDDGIAWLVLDHKDAGTNTLSPDVLDELDDRLDAVERARPKALVIRSAKAGGFVAGADIKAFRGLDDPAEVAQQLKKGHAVLDRLEALEMPTVAVVHGYALGGGFELALACDHRIAIDGASFGFPEVKLGLHPGLGGSFRLTELIDPVEAMTMMLTGKSAHTAKAEALGIVDLVTQERHVRGAVRAIAAGEVDAQQRGLKGSALALAPARALAARQMRAKTEPRAPKRHYPAPHALIDLWEQHGGDRDAMQRGEIDSFAQLLVGDTAQNLVRVFFLREQLKSLGDGDSGISHVHVVGAGTMGGDIAAWCAIRGHRVSLADVDHEALARAVQAAARTCDAQHLSAIDKRDALDRLVPDPKGDGVAAADLVIEAVPEDPKLKRKIHRSLEARMKPGAILATNTSSLALGTMARHLKDPARFAGLHFFNPVSKMQLVEVVAHDGSDRDVLQRLLDFTSAIDRLPAPVRSAPGFVVNRALMPYLLEALLLLDEGVPKEVIDRAAEAFGMAMGPIEVADRVGLDVCLQVAESLREHLDKALPEIPALLREKVEAGDLGRKSGRGFYDWDDGKAQKDDADDDDVSSHPDLEDRLILPMLDACVECLRRRVVAEADFVDAAMIFAAGFAPFRGGPLQHARRRGVDDIVAKLRDLAERHGERFEPDAGWSALNTDSRDSR